MLQNAFKLVAWHDIYRCWDCSDRYALRASILPAGNEPLPSSSLEINLSIFLKLPLLLFITADTRLFFTHLPSNFQIFFTHLSSPRSYTERKIFLDSCRFELSMRLFIYSLKHGTILIYFTVLWTFYSWIVRLFRNFISHSNFKSILQLLRNYHWYMKAYTKFIRIIIIIIIVIIRNFQIQNFRESMLKYIKEKSIQKHCIQLSTMTMLESRFYFLNHVPENTNLPKNP